MQTTELQAENQRNYHKLMVALEASIGRLNLLIAVCDNRNLQEKLMQAYEAELRQQEIRSFRVRLPWRDPSLRLALQQLVQTEVKLQSPTPAIISVVGADSLIAVKLDAEKSEQEAFFFSLQWTREALREFQFPIVLWLTESVAAKLAERAPDFWSWRGGVIWFTPDPLEIEMQSELPNFQLSSAVPTKTESDHAPETPESKIQLEQQIADLQQQITALEHQDPNSPLLITLYNSLGLAYERQDTYDAAIEQYAKSYELAKQTNDRAGKANALGNLGNVYQSLGRYHQAIDFQQQSLEMTRDIGDRNGEANILNNLGNAYYSLGQYQTAIDFYEQSLEIRRDIGDRNEEASSLSNLGNAYALLGQYQRAIDFYEQSLAIRRDIGDLNGEAISLNNLGNAYNSLGQYQRAIDFYEQSLEMTRDIGDRQGEAITWVNLGNTKAKLDRKEAIAAYQNANQLYEAMGLAHKVENCDAVIRNMRQE